MKATGKALLLVIILLGTIIISVARDWKHSKEVERIEEEVRPVKPRRINVGTNYFSKGRSYLFTVKRVIDGDTIEIDTAEKVRYIGVNTPETKHPRKGVEFYGKEAFSFNKQLVAGKKVQLEFDVQQRDKYGRLLAYVYLPDGTFVNALLVRKGYAQVATYPPNVRYQDLFISLQSEAKKAKRGLWQKE